MRLEEAKEILKDHGYIMEKVDKDTQAFIEGLAKELIEIGCDVHFGLNKVGKLKASRSILGKAPASGYYKTFQDKMYVEYNGIELAWFGIDKKGKYNYACHVYTLNHDISKTRCVISLDTFDSRERYASPEEWIDAIQRCINSLDSFQAIARKATQVIKLGTVED